MRNDILLGLHTAILQYAREKSVAVVANEESPGVFMKLGPKGARSGRRSSTMM